MQKQLNKFTYKCRKSVSKKLLSLPLIYKVTKKLHRTYCTLTGFLHVLPDFYIIGTQKGGTSSLYGYMIDHPSIQPCYSKEPSYFDRYFDRGLDWYKVNFPFKIHRFIVTKILQKKFITGEASVRYLDHPHAPQRIKQVTPHAKFIILLRNPIERSYSLYKMISRRHAESLPFEKVIQEEDRIISLYQKMIDDPSYYSDIYFRHGYLHRGIYVDKIKHWMEVFPKEQFLIIQSEEFFREPSKIYNQVLDFLGVENFDLDQYEQFRKQDYSESKLLVDTRKKLVDYFKPHNQRLYEFLGRKFDWE